MCVENRGKLYICGKLVRGIRLEVDKYNVTCTILVVYTAILFSYSRKREGILFNSLSIYLLTV